KTSTEILARVCLQQFDSFVSGPVLVILETEVEFMLLYKRYSKIERSTGAADKLVPVRERGERLIPAAGECGGSQDSSARGFRIPQALFKARSIAIPGERYHRFDVHSQLLR